MDHIAVLRSLSPERKAFLTERSDRVGLLHLALHAGAIATVTVLIAKVVPYWPLLIPVQGVLVSFLFTLAHECTHQTPFRSRRLNEVVGLVTSGLIAMSFTWFRYFHLAHHKYTNDPDRDPELEGGPRPRTWAQYAVYLSGLGYWRGNLSVLWVLAFGSPRAGYLPDRQLPRMRAEARVLLALYALALASLAISPLAFWLWLLPLAVGQPVLRLYLLAEHGLCPPVANMLENTRTTFTTRAVRALAWNMPFHAEHHAFPNVPFHRLPDFHRDVVGHLQSTSDGYAAFTKDYVRHLGAD